MDDGQFAEPPRTEEWRKFHARHLEQQSRAIESIRTYVAIWFWLTIVGAVLLVGMAASAGS